MTISNPMNLRPVLRATLIAACAMLAAGAQLRSHERGDFSILPNSVCPDNASECRPTVIRFAQSNTPAKAPARSLMKQGKVIAYTLNANDDLQTVMDSYTTATQDVVITVPATYTYTKPVVLRNRPGGHWITVQSARHFDPNVRVSPKDAPDMPKLVASGQGGAIVTDPSAPSKGSHPGAAHHYRFAGFEIIAAPGNMLNYAFIGLGTHKETDMIDVPHDISIVNCYIHAPATGEMVRGIIASGDNLEFRSNYIAGFKSTFMEANAILLVNAQNVLVENNYLDGAAENMCTDCDGTSIRGFIPSNITIRHNWFFKDPKYRALKPAVFVKNLLEFKNGKGITVDSNVFEHSWIQNQGGFAVLFTPRTQYGTQLPNTIQNVKFTNNVIRHVAAGISFAAYDDLSNQRANSLVRAAHFVIDNNLFEDVSGSKYGSGYFGMCFQIGGPPGDMTFSNNTCHFASEENRAPVAFFLPGKSDLTDTSWKNNNLGADVMGDGRYGPDAIASQKNPPDPQSPNRPVIFDSSNVIIENDPHWRDLWKAKVPDIRFKPVATSGANVEALAEMEAHAKAGTY